MPYNPLYISNLTERNYEDDIYSAESFHNEALPELLERLITYGQLTQSLHYLSIRNATLTYKAGVTKRRLRLFISACGTHGLEVPNNISRLLKCPEFESNNLRTAIENLSFWLNGELWIIDNFSDTDMSQAFDEWMIQLLLFGLAPRLKKLLIDPEIAENVFDPDYLPGIGLPSVMTLVIPQAVGFSRIILPSTEFRIETLLPRFPSLYTFQNHDSGLTAFPVDIPAQSPPLLPTLRRLLLAGDQPGRLEHVTAILREFPQLEELNYHRRQGVLQSGDPDFCNADLFNGIHHCLRKLTYSSTVVEQQPYAGPSNYNIEINCYEEWRFSDVPNFGGFDVLEELTIDQALLGRMSTIKDQIESPVGPYFPDLAWKLPQSLRCLTIHFVYDWPQLASQFVSIALAKNGGQFPLLTDIYVVLVRAGTITYDYAWSPHIPLLPREDLTRTTGEMLKQASIDLWTRSAAIGPPPGELEDYPREPVPPGNSIKFYIIRRPFRHL